MLESLRSKSGKPSARSSKKVSMKTLLKEDDIRFFFRFVHRYDIREKALEVLNAKLNAKKAH